MQVKVKNRDIFPPEIRDLLQLLHRVGFFEDAGLVGSWVMPLYQAVFGIKYVLRTLDIDFAVKFVSAAPDKKVDIERIPTNIGFVPVMMQSGMRKFTREGFTVEFVVHRRGGKDDKVVPVNKWNIIALPLPFVDLLLDFSFTAKVDDFAVKAPLPEAFFIHKLITAQRRLEETKRSKDLEQCTIIARHLDSARLRDIVRSTKLSKKIRKEIHASCEAINFSPQQLGC
jgi:hypothetical protein